MAMEKTVIGLGLLGLGTVGTGVVQVLRDNAREIGRKVGAPIVIKKALVHNAAKERPGLEDLELVTDIDAIVNDPEIDIVVELMGGIAPAKDYMLRAMAAGKSVVTANKDVVAQHGLEMFGAAVKNGVDFLFEASVGGGIPIITTFKQCLTANRFTEVMGIVNGTTNYMLTKMTNEGMDYDVALKEAQAEGYAEADPTADVGGLDAARKAAILASLAFNTHITLEDVQVEGITNVSAVDIEYARKLDYVVKLLAIARRVEGRGIDVRVHPTFLTKDHPLASVNGVFNAIFVRGNAIGDAMFYGRGAGGRPTASAVIADVVEAARGILTDSRSRINPEFFEPKQICPIEETESRYYMRLRMDDRPGVLGSVATAFGWAGVSLKSVLQRHVDDGAEVVIVTHTTKHSSIVAASQSVAALPGNAKVCSVIRVDKSLENG